ncbi:MAG: ankyrin repeat domain-containing protein [Wolbachia sp.]
MDCAVEHNNRKMVTFLVSKGIDANDQDFNGNARLHKASYNGDTKAVRLLLELKVNVNAVTKCNRTPLLLAVKKGNTKIVKMLLEVKANMNICEQQGYTSLHLAVQRDYFDIAQLLIEKGADLIPSFIGNGTNEKELFLAIIGKLSKFITYPICLPNNECWY